MGQWSGCGRRDGRSGSGGGSGFFASAALAESAALAVFLLSLDDFAADFDANLFCEAGAEAGFAVFDDVAHAGARSNKAQLPKRQCRIISFKPTMAPLRMMVCDSVLSLSRSLEPAHVGSRQAMVVIINMLGCAVWFDCPPPGQKHVGFSRREPPGTISGR